MIKQQLSFIALAASMALAVPHVARAQEGSEEMENLFGKEEQPAPQPEIKPETQEAAPPKSKLPDVKEVTDLGKLESFDDVAVIQKRYLPKTKRFELYAAPTIIMNDAFFLNFGLDGRLAYYFSERYGVEAMGRFLTVSERQVTSDLREKRDVSTSSFVTPKAYYGVDFKWVPVYGKMAWRNKKIAPFDLYISTGLGLTSTNQSRSETTFHMGTGQAFALSKGRTFRWDFSWHAFNGTVKNDKTGVETTSLYHNLFLSFGMSFFFPEATYR